MESGCPSWAAPWFASIGFFTRSNLLGSHFLKHLNFLPVLLASTLLLAACGGGGDSTPAPASAGTTRLTQTDIQTTASLGALTLLGADSDAKTVMAFGDSLLNGTSTVGGGSTLPGLEACTGGGTLTSSVTKSASRVGYAAGDQLLVTFSNCSLSGLVFNGSMRLTAQGTISNVGSSYDIRYVATLTNWSIRSSSLTTTISGSMDINSSNTVSAFTVPANQSLSSTNTTTSSGTATTSYRAGTAVRSVDTASPNTASRSLTGSVVVATGGTQLTFDVATPTAFSGTTSNGRFLPNTGTMTFRQSGGGLNASVSVSGNTVTVSGDTDGNGTQDLSFTTTWTAITF